MVLLGGATLLYLLAYARGTDEAATGTATAISSGAAVRALGTKTTGLAMTGACALVWSIFQRR